jgi:hypothetical protein
MASLSLHHVRTLAEKSALFGNIFAALPSGGVLVNADVTMPTAEPARGDRYDSWADHLVSSGMKRAEAFRHFEAWADEDVYFPLEDELEALSAAGFEASCVWNEGVSTVVVARRP